MRAESFYRHVALTATLSCLSATVLAQDDGPRATPYRPSLANPAELSAPGWLEIEAGWQRNRIGGDYRRDALPYTAKLAFSADWGILLGGEARLRLRENGENHASFGDTSFILKRRIASDDQDLNFGIEAGFTAPTARRNLGSGQADWTVNGIVSYDFPASWHLDANLGVTRLGVPEADQGRTAILFAASLSKQIGDWNLALESSGTRQRNAPGGRQWLATAAYAVAPALVLDAGLARNRQAGETERSVFFGFTWLAVKLF